MALPAHRTPADTLRPVLTALLAALALTSCAAPLKYIARSPVPVPELDPVEPVEPYRADPGDCPSYRWDPVAAAWSKTAWATGGTTQTIPRDFRHPATDAEGFAVCLHLAIPPGAWIAAREGRDRLPLVEAQRDALLRYIADDRALDAEEDRRLSELVKTARRRQWEAFAVGGGVGAAVVAVVVVGVVAASR